MILIAGALFAAASTLSAQAADPSAERQAQMADSFYPHALQPAEGRTTAAPARDAADKSRPAAPARSANPSWWEEERALDDGYAWPTPSASRRGNAATVRAEGDNGR